MPKYLLKRKENICLHKDLYVIIYNRFIKNFPKQETTQTNIQQLINGQLNHGIATQWNTIALIKNNC